MKTVFFNSNPIFLVTDLSYETENNFYHIKDADLLSIIENMERGSLKSVYLYNDNLKELWKRFSRDLHIIEAGGGKVYNTSNEVLFIFRNDKWDLPKGKIEKGESIEEAATREAEEETGINGLQIEEALETTYHIYKYKSKYVLKISYWFKMTSNYNGELIPQIEEGITKVEWLSKSKVDLALKNTYENIKLLF